MEKLVAYDYEHYLNLQAQKTLGTELRTKLQEQFEDKTKLFELMLRKVRTLVPQKGKVLCLGSRMGEEVQAFINMGFDAIGIDLVPNPPLVVVGDFNKLKETYEKSSFDIIYCNALDHIWESQMFKEGCLHILRPQGLIVLHLCLRTARKYETHIINTPQEVIDVFCPPLKVVVDEKGFLKDMGGDLAIGGLTHELILRSE